MSIGNENHAAMALAATHEFRDLCKAGDFGDLVEQGTWDGRDSSWTLSLDDVAMLGRGSCRTVWTIDGEVAYKVNHGETDEDNSAEWRRWKKYNHLMPEGTRLPMMTAYRVKGRLILAVEVIKFPRQWGYNPNRSVPRLPFDFMDNGEYNYRWSPDGIFIPIDFAC